MLVFHAKCRFSVFSVRNVAYRVYWWGDAQPLESMVCFDYRKRQHTAFRVSGALYWGNNSGSGHGYGAFTTSDNANYRYSVRPSVLSGKVIGFLCRWWCVLYPVAPPPKTKSRGF